jgi:hypothetical protein
MSDAFTGHDDNRDEAARPGDGVRSACWLPSQVSEPRTSRTSSMTLDIDIVLNTEANKPIDPAVEVIAAIDLVR